MEHTKLVINYPTGVLFTKSTHLQKNRWWRRRMICCDTTRSSSATQWRLLQQLINYHEEWHDALAKHRRVDDVT